MPIDPPRVRSVDETRTRILDVALEVLGQDPDAGMGEIASRAGVVRRTVYGHFPSRGDLVLSLAQQAATEVAAVLAEVDAGGPADVVWVDFVARLWPLARRYRVLLELRRSAYSKEVHALLAPVETTLADLVQRGQDSEVVGRHLPAPVLSQLAYAAVFTLAESGLHDSTVDAGAATVASLLVLGVPAARARALVDDQA